MGARYLTDLADVCRAVGLHVIEVDGWQTRARGSGGYDSGRPTHVMIHHTASGPSSDGWDDVNYCTFHDDDAPLCNLYLSRSGDVYICAAGATNTNGSGIDPCGVCPDDSMNGHAIGIEAGNGGTGETWPDPQLDAFVRLTRALCDAYGIDVAQVHSHQQYAPTRKSDPAGPPRYATGAQTWNVPAFCDDVRALDSGDDDMPSAQEIATAVWNDPRITSEVDGKEYPPYVFVHATHGLAFHGDATAVWNEPRITSEVDGRDYEPWVYLKSIHGVVVDLQKRLEAIESKL